MEWIKVEKLSLKVGESIKALCCNDKGEAAYGTLFFWPDSGWECNAGVICVENITHYCIVELPKSCPHCKNGILELELDSIPCPYCNE